MAHTLRPPTRGLGNAPDPAPTLDAPVRGRGWPAWWPAVLASLALLAAYVGLSFVNDPRGFLGTDTGGKVATLEVMQRGGADPDLGYWAADLDPDGDLHPLYYTYPFGERWVNVTTLPALLVAEPLYDLAGYRGALLVPMLGALLAAHAARALTERIGGRPWLAFWVIGLASPLVVYALDFWEHTLGVAALGWALVWLHDVRTGRRPAAWAGVAALAIGAAGTMRTEALLYGAIAVAGVMVLRTLARDLKGAAIAGITAAVGVVVPLAGNQLLEKALIGEGIRASRAAGTAAGAGIDMADRIEEGLITSVVIRAQGSTTAAIAIGLACAGLLAATVALAMSADGERRRYAPVVAAVVAVIFFVPALGGLGFLPGLTAAAPLAAVGVLALRTKGTARELALYALLVLPGVWATQFTGGAWPQWGGRYVLVSGFVLTVVGLRVLVDAPRWVRVWGVALAVGVSALGLGWMHQRTHSVAATAEVIVGRDEPVLVSTVGHLFREVGAVYTPERRWLTAEDAGELQRSLQLAASIGADRVAVLAVAETRPDLSRYRVLDTETVSFLSGISLDVIVVDPRPR